MKSFHFSLGNSSNGPIGFCARIAADSPEAAVERLKSMLPESWGTDTEYGLTPDSMNSVDEYIAVYFGSAITVADIDEVDDDDDDEASATDALPAQNVSA